MKLPLSTLPILLAPLTLPPSTSAAPNPIPPQFPTNTPNGTWHTLSPIPLLPRQEHITIAIPPSSFAILGGIVPVSGPGPQLYSTTSLIQFYDTRTDTWRSGPSMPIPLNHANAAYLNGKIYLLCGLEVGPDGVWRATDRSWVYHTHLQGRGEWRELERIPAAAGVARGSAAVGVYGDRIYLAGGMTVLSTIPGAGGEQEQGSIAGVAVFDTKAEKWVVESEGGKPVVADLPAARDHAGAAVVRGTMYVLGGRDHGQVNVRDTVFALDLTSRSGLERGWVTRGGRMPTARGGLAAAAVGGRVYTFGGEGNLVGGSNGVFDQTEVYDVGKDSWERLGPMKVARHGTYAVAVRERVYIPGGGVAMGAGPVDILDVFEPYSGK